MGKILYMEDYYKDEISELVEEAYAIFNATHVTNLYHLKTIMCFSAEIDC